MSACIYEAACLSGIAGLWVNPTGIRFGCSNLVHIDRERCFAAEIDHDPFAVLVPGGKVQDLTLRPAAAGEY